MIRRLWPASIRAELALLLVSGVLIIHGLMFALLLTEKQRDAAERAHPAEVTGELAAIVRQMRAEAPAVRPGLLARLGPVFPAYDLALGPPLAAVVPPPGRPVAFTRAGAVPLSRLLGGVPVVEERDEAGRLRLQVALDDAASLHATIADRFGVPPGLPFPFGGPALTTLAVLVASFVLLSLWAAHALARPLRAIARQAAAWDIAAAPAGPIEAGAAEVRAVSRAIADMQARIARLVADRTRLLTAVSHDLRTPITRLRLRAELMPDAAERRRMLADLEQMDALVVGALGYLRDGRTGEARHRVDLASLVATVADAFVDMGHDVPVTIGAAVAIDARPRELARAFTNLIDNALKHAGDAAVTVGLSPAGAARVEVSDTGPGVAAAGREALFEAFVRGDAARGMNDNDGFGLGLSIARAIILAHGGEISLHDATPRGLVVRVDLPLAAAA